MVQASQNIVDVAHHMGYSSKQLIENYVYAADKQFAAQVNPIEWFADLAIA